MVLYSSADKHHLKDACNKDIYVIFEIKFLRDEEKLRILIFAGRPMYSEYHGGATHLREVARHLSALGHEVIVGSIDYRLKKSINIIKDNGVTSISVKPDTRLFGPLVSSSIVFRLVRNIKRCDLVYIRGSPDDYIATLIGVLWNVPIILEVNDPTWTWPTLKWSDRIITPHKSALTINIEGKRVEGRWLKKIGEKSIVMFPGCNIKMFKPGIDGSAIRERYKIPSESFVVVYSGGFYIWHGIEDLIEASTEVIKKHPKTYFIYVGYGPTFDEAVKTVECKDDIKNRSVFTGEVPYELMPKFIAAADVTVAPYCPQRHIVMRRLGFYNIGIKVLEYMAAGKPVITTDTGSIRKVIQNGVNGLLVEPCNPKALAKAIMYLIENKEVLNKFSVNARRTAESFSWYEHTKRLVDIFTDILRSRKMRLNLSALYDIVTYCVNISIRRVNNRLKHFRKVNVTGSDL